MNLWGNRIGQLAVLSVALFFLSCEDEASKLGFKNPTTKLNVSYIEIPVESSVIMLDSIRSSNYLPYFSTETNRLLVGKYQDDQFGAVSTAAYTQYFTTSSTKLAASAAFDSVSITLRFDFYNYGSKSPATVQEIYIHELDKELKRDSVRNYFNKTTFPVKPTPLGSKTFTVNPEAFAGYVAVNKDTTITVHMPLDNAFGQRIFESALKYRDATTAEDSAFVRYSEFTKEFYGIAILPGSNDKIVGFNPGTTASKITLHYHTDTTDSLELNLSITGTTSFNTIVSDRTATPELAGLNPTGSQYFEDYTTTDKRFIQSGVGIFTKLDFSNYFEFADAIPNMIINSAELVIESVEDPGDFAPPENLVLRVLKENNRQYPIKASDTQSATDLRLYNNYVSPDYTGNSLGVAVDSDSVFTVVNDLSGYLKLEYAKDKDTYSGFLSFFMQQLFYKEENKTRFKNFVLYPSSPASAKTVNRVVFPKDAIKLKIYYTKPNTN